MDAKPTLDWQSETFGIEGLGIVTVTGTPSNGLLKSEPGTCRFRGRRIEVSAECRFPPNGPPEILVLLAGSAPGAGRRLDDDEVDGVREAVEEALAEWWSTPEARAMLAGNAERDVERAAGGTRQQLSASEARLAECARLLAAAPETAADAAALVREMAELHVAASRLRSALAAAQP